MPRLSTCLACAVLGALLLLSQGAAAQTSAVTPAAGTAHEWEVVSTASRKMLEVQRETDACVVDGIPWFLERAGLAYHTALTASASPGSTSVMYGVMQAAGSAMKGRGPVSTATAERMYHVSSAANVFNYNVSDNWKKLEAEKLSKQTGGPVKPDSDAVRAAWENAVTDGKDIPADMLLPDSLAMPALSWVTPDPRMAIPAAASRAQGTEDFFHLCHVLSLAPEWYPEGLVNMSYPAHGTILIRPVSFDGMLSPLWVQRPARKPAATGGGAPEAFNRDDIRVSQAGPMRAYIVTRAMTAALEQSPSVNRYSVDLDKVAHGGDRATRMLGEQETSIVRQVRAARRQADAAFATVVPPGTPTAQCEPKPKKRTMLLPSGRDGLTGLALQTEMTRWALGHFLQNPSQRFAADRFEAAMQRAPQRRRAIMAAATALLRRSDRLDVLVMAAQLGRTTKYRPFYVALLDRLAGKPRPLPAGAGIRTLTLRGDLLLRLEDSLPGTDPTLARRAIARAGREGRPDLRLAIALSRRSPAKLLAAFADATTYRTIDPWLAARAGYRIAQVYPGRLSDALRAATALRPAARRLFAAAVAAGRDRRLAAR